MRKVQKEQAYKLVELLSKAHEEIRKTLSLELLLQCQTGAIELGNFIEKFEGENCATVRLLEEYCELVYNIHEEISQASSCNLTINENKIYKNLRKKLIQIENSVKNDIPLRREAVFLPYKASMWDSMESVYLAAKADPCCDAYVIPIPYYDRKPDGSLGQEHYEGDLYAEDIPITPYDTYDFGQHRPDMIFIHNPYDGCNMVTSVHPFFYSDKIKKCTDCLVYIPYFATAGGMGESYLHLPVYDNVDYIVIQSEKVRQYYDPDIPDSKFLAFGSPKFDSVIRKCQNPPQIPDEWKDKMLNEDGSRNKVYFYNTSIGGMLSNTAVFLNKLEYVLDTFRQHPEVCLLWRPHPLLESTFDSMRKGFKPRFDEIRKRYIEENIGIYDTTASIENSIALSDVYIGDSGTSVTSLFGVAGKPEFIFNNYIDTKPNEDDWRGEVITFPFSPDGDNRWIVTKGNKLWHSDNNDYNYRYYCDLKEYTGGSYYLFAKQIGEKVYVFPNSAQDILVVKDKKIRRIGLKKENSLAGAFCGIWYTERYAILIPYNYPNLVRFEFKTEKIVYVNNISKFLVRTLNNEKVIGATRLVGNMLYMASPIDSDVLSMDIDTFEINMANIPLPENATEDIGSAGIVPQGDWLWMFPLNGMVLRCWNPITNEMKAYDKIPEGFKSIKWPYEIEVKQRPFGNIVFYKDRAFISPSWGNMYLSLDIKSGEMKQWTPPKEVTQEMRGRNGYFLTGGMGGFMYPSDENGNCLVWDAANRKIVNINFETMESNEIHINFDKAELEQQEAGFGCESEWMPYCCKENAFNSIDDLINENIIGNQHNREVQIETYMTMNAAPNGDCGERLYQYLCSR